MFLTYLLSLAVATKASSGITYVAPWSPALPTCEPCSMYVFRRSASFADLSIQSNTNNAHQVALFATYAVQILIDQRYTHTHTHYIYIYIYMAIVLQVHFMHFHDVFLTEQLNLEGRSSSRCTQLSIEALTDRRERQRCMQIIRLN